MSDYMTATESVIEVQATEMSNLRELLKLQAIELEELRKQIAWLRAEREGAA